MDDDEIDKRIAGYTAEIEARMERVQFENDLGIYKAQPHVRKWLDERSARKSTKH
jgi:hypothetical protein